MRKHLNIATESLQPLMIALEDEEPMREEAEAALVEVGTGLDEVARTTETSENLEDLAAIAAGTDEVTPDVAALIENNAAALVTGTDVAPSEIVPIVASPEDAPAAGSDLQRLATEAYAGKKISMEGIEQIKQVARTIWENIQKFLKKIWEKIETFFYKIVGALPRLRREIESLRKRISDAESKKLEDKTIKVTSGTAYFCVEYKAIKDPGALVTKYGEFTAAAKACFGTDAKALAGTGEKLAELIGDFDAAKPNESLAAINNYLIEKVLGSQAANDAVLKAVGSGSKDTTRFSGFNTQMSKPMLGNLSIAVKEFANQSDRSELGNANVLRRAGTELVSTAASPKDAPSDVEINTMTTSNMEAILKDAEQMIDTLEEYSRGKNWKDVVASKKKLEAASQKAQKSFEKVQNDAERHADAIPAYRAALDFNGAFANWATKPYTKMYAESLAVTRAMIMAVTKSLSAYK